VALHQAMEKLMHMGVISKMPLKSAVAATSIGIVNTYTLLDLCYDEDSQAAVDFNIVMTGKGEFVELQGTAEGKPFTKQNIDEILALGEKGIRQLFTAQQDVLKP
jgi:ribonuclease PH